MRLPLFVFLSLLTIFSSATLILPLAPAEAGIIPCGLSKPDPAITTADQGTAKCTLCHLVVGIQNIIVLLRNIMSAIAVAVLCRHGVHLYHFRG